MGVGVCVCVGGGGGGGRGSMKRDGQRGAMGWADNCKEIGERKRRDVDRCMHRPIKHAVKAHNISSDKTYRVMLIGRSVDRSL